MGSSKFSGEFMQAMFVRGDYIDPNGTLYSGSFTGFKVSCHALICFFADWCFCDQLCQGQARVVYADGSVYTGHVRDSLREGTGVMEWADKSHFDGSSPLWVALIFSFTRALRNRRVEERQACQRHLHWRAGPWSQVIRGCDSSLQTWAHD